MPSVPVINGLTDLSHPCQILADMLTLIERKARLAGSKWAWVGDGNNVCNSLIEAASLMHFELKVGCPEGSEPDSVMRAAAAVRGANIEILDRCRRSRRRSRGGGDRHLDVDGDSDGPRRERVSPGLAGALRGR